MERRVGKEELDRREAEKKLKALNKKKLSKRQYAAQKAALDARLRDFDQRRKQRKDKIQAWQGKMDKLGPSRNLHDFDRFRYFIRAGKHKQRGYWNANAFHTDQDNIYPAVPKYKTIFAGLNRSSSINC